MKPVDPPVIGVIGLGYVGLPVAVSFARSFSVIGFDINTERVSELNRGYDRHGEYAPDALQREGLMFTDQVHDLKRATFYIVAVPTPIDTHKIPDLGPLRQASEMIASLLKVGDTVVYESTVFPGCTEEICLPILEKSGLKAGKDFHLGYSPERINPGDKEHTLERIVKVVSALTPEGLTWISSIYGQVIKAGLHQAPSIRVAEAIKIIENTQRDLNIALINELAMFFQEMGLSIYDILEGAGTKWNFHSYFPGLVGGHCISVDPYYLTYKATALGFHPQLILAGRQINDSFPRYLAERILQKLNQLQVYPPIKVLILGFTFKENITDIRNTKVYDLAQTLKSYGVEVDITDPLAHPQEVFSEYGIELISPKEGAYDAIVIAVPHAVYRRLTPKDFKKWAKDRTLIVDIRGIFRKENWEGFFYWSL
ncbi:MAG: nucleotide sugar dehydrogenase [Bacteroidia bacterium]|nr:nucleotide sugar dehydrogenase [Bacteroidia bacterium]